MARTVQQLIGRQLVYTDAANRETHDNQNMQFSDIRHKYM